jgi:hypothetical protein
LSVRTTAKAKIGDRIVETVVKVMAILLLEADDVVFDTDDDELLDGKRATDQVRRIIDDKAETEDRANGHFVFVVSEARNGCGHIRQD